MTSAVGHVPPNNMAAYDILGDEWEMVVPATITLPESQFNAMQHQLAQRINAGEFAERQSLINEDLLQRIENLEKDKKALENKKISAEAEAGILKNLALFGAGCLFYGQSGGVGAGIFIYDVIQSANVIMMVKNVYSNSIEWKNAKA